MELEEYRQFCLTDNQWEKFKAGKELGQRPAARQLGVSPKTIYDAIKAVEKRARAHIVTPEADGIQKPTHLPVTGTSTYVRLKDADDDSPGPVAAWIKTKRDKEEQFQHFQDAVEEVASNLKPLKPTKPPKSTNDDLMTIYPLGDPHVGMYAWARETGEDFDCDIARQDLTNAMSYLTSAAPSSTKGVVLNLGDFFHTDDPSNRTKRSGNELDVDTRWARVLELGIHTMVDLIQMALKKHDEVEVINVIGNHDDNSSVMLSCCLQAWFHNDPRVTVRAPGPKHIYLQFGKVLIGTTHGDQLRGQQKKRDLAALMANDCVEMWSETAHRYWYTGHIHSSNAEELIGVKWESFRNLAPNDAWHQGEGYRSGRDLIAITHHKDHGEVSRLTCNLSMIRHD